MADIIETIQNTNQSNLQMQAGDRKAEIEEHSRRFGSLGSSEYTGSSQPVSDFGEEILEGKGSSDCSCRVTDFTALGEPVFTCCEATPGECMYRIGSEPDLTCLYCLVRNEGGTVRRACIREEANDYARRKMYEDIAEKQESMPAFQIPEV